MSDINKAERLDYLDSARGIAALMVMFGHLINWKYGDRTIVHAASIVINANDAVSFFFVLSGMVLSYPYLQLSRPLDIGKFYVNRVFRIYPAYWVALLVCTFYGRRYDFDTYGIAGELKRIFITNDERFWQEFFLFKGYNMYYVPGWTLSIELVYSFLMPFLVAIARYNRKLVPWLVVVSLVSSYVTGIFLFHFALGLFLGAYFSTLNSASFKSTFWYRYRLPLIILFLPLFSMRQWTKIWPVGGSTLHEILDYLKLDFFHASAFASFLFIMGLIHYRKLRNLFELRLLVFFGRISYGIYLMHWVWVWAIGDYWESRVLPHFPNAAMALLASGAACLVITVVLATLLHYAVELPFMKLGKKVVRRMKPTVSV